MNNVKTNSKAEAIETDYKITLPFLFFVKTNSKAEAIETVVVVVGPVHGPVKTNSKAEAIETPNSGACTLK